MTGVNTKKSDGLCIRKTILIDDSIFELIKNKARKKGLSNYKLINNIIGKNTKADFVPYEPHKKPVGQKNKKHKKTYYGTTCSRHTIIMNKEIYKSMRVATKGRGDRMYKFINKILATYLRVNLESYPKHKDTNLSVKVREAKINKEQK